MGAEMERSVTDWRLTVPLDIVVHIYKVNSKGHVLVSDKIRKLSNR